MYRVRWRRKALARLAAIWNAATDRNAVTAASHRIDQALIGDPHNHGESRPGHRRIMFEQPLVVVYRIDDATTVVTVLAVRAY